MGTYAPKMVIRWNMLKSNMKNWGSFSPKIGLEIEAAKKLIEKRHMTNTLWLAADSTASRVIRFLFNHLGFHQGFQWVNRAGVYNIKPTRACQSS